MVLTSLSTDLFLKQSSLTQFQGHFSGLSLFLGCLSTLSFLSLIPCASSGAVGSGWRGGARGQGARSIHLVFCEDAFCVLDVQTLAPSHRKDLWTFIRDPQPPTLLPLAAALTPQCPCPGPPLSSPTPHNALSGCLRRPHMASFFRFGGASPLERCLSGWLKPATFFGIIHLIHDRPCAPVPTASLAKPSSLKPLALPSAFALLSEAAPGSCLPLGCSRQESGSCLQAPNVQTVHIKLSKHF